MVLEDYPVLATWMGIYYFIPNIIPMLPEMLRAANSREFHTEITLFAHLKKSAWLKLRNFIVNYCQVTLSDYLCPWRQATKTTVQFNQKERVLKTVLNRPSTLRGKQLSFALFFKSLHVLLSAPRFPNKPGPVESSPVFWGQGALLPNTGPQTESASHTWYPCHKLFFISFIYFKEGGRVCSKTHRTL